MPASQSRGQKERSINYAFTPPGFVKIEGRKIEGRDRGREERQDQSCETERERRGENRRRYKIRTARQSKSGEARTRLRERGDIGTELLDREGVEIPEESCETERGKKITEL